MERPPLQRQGATVHPWYTLVNDLFEEFDAEEIEKALLYYKDVLDFDDYIDDDEDTERQYLRLQQKFYNALDKEEDKLKCANYLMKVMDKLQMHNSLTGKAHADHIQMKIQDIQKYINESEVKQNTVFIGRDHTVKAVIEIISGCEYRYITGVCVTGMGGQGKSAVARKICQELQKSGWCTYTIDLRNTYSTVDVVKAILLTISHNCPQHDMLNQLLDMLVGEIKDIQQSILFCMDDCDHVLERDKTAFSNFRTAVLMAANGKSEGTVKFLFTTRQKLVTPGKKIENTLFTRSTDDLMAEIELASLEPDDAKELLLKYSELNDIEDHLAGEIIEECACSPLAIKVVSELIRPPNVKFSPLRLTAHLKLDKRNVTKALKVDYCIDQAIHGQDLNSQMDIVRLSVFKSEPFDRQSAEAILSSGTLPKDVKRVLQNLHNAHLIEVTEKRNSSHNADDEIRGKTQKLSYSLHPLVYRFISEWKKPRDIQEAYDKAVPKFVHLYEGIINSIVKALDTKCDKGMKKLHTHKGHILQFYDFLENKVPLLDKYPKKAKLIHVLTKKRVSDLADLLLSNVKKKRLFESEAERAKQARNDDMYVFWMVEKADVFLMLDDKVTLAMEVLDGLTNGRFPSLRGLHDDAFYPPLVHALFHKVKGLSRWKQQRFQEAVDHLQLSLRFYDKCKSSSFDVLAARVLNYMGKVYLDIGNLDEAENTFRKGYEKVLTLVATKRGDSAANKELQWDIPNYYGHFGEIKLEKARMKEAHSEAWTRYLDGALEDLNKGIELDTKLNMDNLDRYCIKQKLKADVFIEKGLLEDALTIAEKVMDQRRQILQLPHINVTASVFQVARIYMFIGNRFKKQGDIAKAKAYWRTSSDYFRELEDHHLINGSIEKTHPMFAIIKKEHFEMAERARDAEDVKKLIQFYQKVEGGGYISTVMSRLKNFKEMLFTPKEVVEKEFGDGGHEFGANDELIQRIEDQAGDQMNEMIQEAMGGGGGRKDSGMGHSSTEFGESLSSGSGSMTSQLDRMRLEKSLSLEDNVFDETVPDNQKAKQPKKRQRTIEEESTN